MVGRLDEDDRSAFYAHTVLDSNMYSPHGFREIDACGEYIFDIDIDIDIDMSTLYRDVDIIMTWVCVCGAMECHHRANRRGYKLHR